MDGKTGAVFGLYESASQAEEALDYLTAERFASNKISFLMRDALGSSGAGGTLALLAGVSAVTLPDGDKFIAAGSIRDVFASLAEEGRLRSLLVALSALSIPKHHTRHLAERIKEGRVLLSVYCGNSTEAAIAERILKATRAETILSSESPLTDDDSTAMPHSVS